MTKVICSTSRLDGPLYFDCIGHSDYQNPDTGNNDVCVITSTLCNFLVTYITLKGFEPRRCEDGHVTIELEESTKDINETFNAVMQVFSMVSEQYTGKIKVY